VVEGKNLLPVGTVVLFVVAGVVMVVITMAVAIMRIRF
jgi:hypothetical protein